MTSAAVALRSFEQLIVSRLLQKIEQAQLSTYELDFFATHGFAYQNSLADIMRAGMALNVRIDMRS